jgi:hypothetical protein
MSGPWKRPVASATLTAVIATSLAAAAAGCTNSGETTSNPSTLISQAASALASAGAQATGAIVAAAGAAEKKLSDIKNGVDARDEVSLGTPQRASDGRVTVEVTAHNTADSSKSFAVQVNFKDVNGNLLDATVVTVSDVAASGSKKATAHSNRSLSGEVKPEVVTALRY